jgi:hypothetical protein
LLPDLPPGIHFDVETLPPAVCPFYPQQVIETKDKAGNKIINKLKQFCNFSVLLLFFKKARFCILRSCTGILECYTRCE